ncbi:S-4TM family putative pore-forming effector [Lactobacillus agrestimuris]|uniref:S-4TM family putative pore-forming effector n=1 Tax=Lactobacillus agrestimuris TaxID=2941328 RepID=UPI0020443DF1|nr:S-4TM family putative pore-forming effector [Lactobacillus agrestimuris]
MFTEELQERQNDTINIKRLATQRKLYSEAKIINYCNFVVTVLIPILISVLSTIPNWTLLRLPIIMLIFHAYTLLAIGLQYWLTTLVSKLKKFAAHIQLKFDIDVFVLDWDTRFLGIDNDYELLVAKKCEKFSEKKLNSLYNWYDLSKLKDKEKMEVIRLCQKQNLQWNFTIRRRANTKLNGLVIVSIIICFFIMIFLRTNLAQITNSMINFVPLITWIIAVNKNYKRDKAILSELHGLVNDKRYVEDTALLIEAKITEYRQNSSLIPDFIYHIHRNGDEKVFRQAQIITAESHASKK